MTIRGHLYTLKELRTACGDQTIADLHKMVENLKFVGDLKKLFFRVSKDAICFTPKATMGQLATLRIDPKDLS